MVWNSGFEVMIFNNADSFGKRATCRLRLTQTAVGLACNWESRELAVIKAYRLGHESGALSRFDNLGVVTERVIIARNPLQCMSDSYLPQVIGRDSPRDKVGGRTRCFQKIQTPPVMSHSFRIAA